MCEVQMCNEQTQPEKKTKKITLASEHGAEDSSSTSTHHLLMTTIVPNTAEVRTEG